MKKDPEIFDDDLELENILKPRTEFRVSLDFKQRVMEEARAMPTQRSHRWISLVASSAAAAVAAIVILSVWIFRSPDSNTDRQPVAASVEIPVPPSSDTIKKETSAPLIAEATPSIRHSPSSQRPTARKKSLSKAAPSPQFLSSEASDEVHPHHVSAGEMPKTSREGPLDPNEVRTHLIETRRNAEIAYIEQMRDEIEANQSYIEQLMADANVNQ